MSIFFESVRKASQEKRHLHRVWEHQQKPGRQTRGRVFWVQESHVQRRGNKLTAGLK